MRMSDWSSDVCASDLGDGPGGDPVRQSPASVSPGAAPEHAPVRARGGGATPDDPRGRSPSVPADSGLPVPLPLSRGRAGVVRRHDAGDAAGRPRPSRGVPQAWMRARGGARAGDELQGGGTRETGAPPRGPGAPNTISA